MWESRVDKSGTCLKFISASRRDEHPRARACEWAVLWMEDGACSPRGGTGACGHSWVSSSIDFGLCRTNFLNRSNLGQELPRQPPFVYSCEGVAALALAKNQCRKLCSWQNSDNYVLCKLKGRVVYKAPYGMG